MKHRGNTGIVRFVKVVSVLLLLVCYICLSIPADAAGTYTEPGSNISSQYWSNPVKCHTISNADGSVTIMYSVWNGSQQILYIDRFSSAGARLSHKGVAVPGKTWGGTVYRGPDGCNYIATGNGADAAYYISKYSADWNLIRTTAIGQEESYTNTAYRSSNSDMTMVGDYLIVHAGRGRLDGHQSNTTFVINKNTMQAVYVTGAFGTDHVSHSFSQFIRSDGNQVLMVDHGDAYPREIVFQTYQMDSSGSPFQNLRQLSLFDIKGQTGQNYTGVTVDGFELGSANHVVAGTSIPHDTFASDAAFAAYEGSNNVFVILINKNLQSSGVKWLTSYSNVQVSNLEMVKINDNRFLLLYGTKDANDNCATCYMIIDSNGTVQSSGSIPKTFYCTSEPSVNGNVITWCHYVESELGNFLVMNRWDIGTGSFQVFNLDTGIASKISKIDGSSQYTLRSGQEAELTQEVYSDIFRKEFPTAPAVWESSDPDILEVLDEESILSSSVTNNSYKDVSAKVRAKKTGTVTVTCRVGDKKSTIKCKVTDKVTKLSFGRKKITLKLGQSYKANASGSNGNKVTWQSSNSRVAKVNKKGVITARRAGKVTITAKAGGKKAVLTVKVSKAKWKPPKTKITRWKKAGKNKVKVFWKKKDYITGYQVSYAGNKKFKNVKVITVKRAGRDTVKLKNLAGKKKYYVRVRSYKDAEINGKKVRLYSKWSARKSVRR